MILLPNPPEPLRGDALQDIRQLHGYITRLTEYLGIALAELDSRLKDSQ